MENATFGATFTKNIIMGNIIAGIVISAVLITGAVV